MGGGDLNLKKSWHPSTMKNIEKVWKAEQQQNQEKRRIAELKKELEMEKDREDIKKYAMEQGVIETKDDKKLDWMYKGPNQLISREEYLLGRPIDKSFEQMAQAEKDSELNHAPRNHVEHECIPPSLRFFSGNEQVDLARKMQEDPLYAIKKKEMETRNQLLKNPVKLKQLRQLLEQQSKKNKSEAKQKKKKKCKQGVDTDDEAQLDLLLATKFKQLKEKISDKDLIKSVTKVNHKRKAKLRKDSDSSTSDSESTSGSDMKKYKKKRSRSNSHNTTIKYDNKVKHLTSMPREGKRKNKTYENEFRNRSSSIESTTNSMQERRNILNRRDVKKTAGEGFRSKSPRDRKGSFHKNTRNNENNIENSSGTNKLHRNDTRHYRNSASVKRNYEEDRSKNKWNFKKKQLTEEEKERRRQEMIANATWRDKERERNVRKYREEEKREIDSGKVYNQDFVTKQLAAAAEIGTVASRIKSNINNIQRSRSAMNTNFAKR